MYGENKRQGVIIKEPNKDALTNLDIDKLVEQTLTIISTHLPEWRAQERFKVLIWNTNADQGCYIGRWEGVHHHLITISGENDILSPYNRLRLQLRIAHELFHQRSAELLKTDDINEKGLEEKLKLPRVAKMAEIKKIELAFGLGAGSSFLQKIVTEGFAVYGEIELCKSLLNSNSLSPEEAGAVKDSLKFRQTALLADNSNNQYISGYQLISKLVNRFGIHNLAMIFEKIDWDACGKIQQDTPEYINIMMNPEQLPGLEQVLNQ